MSSFTLIEKHNSLKRGSTIAVRPYVEEHKRNMGLEKYNLALFEGVFHEEQLACLENNGIRRYLTGLNEFAPEVMRIADTEEREAKIKDIRTTVSFIEQQLNANTVKPEDPEFWSKIRLLRPDNDQFWSKINIRCSNEPVFLDPYGDVYDLIKIKAIEAGGFSIIAKSLEDARKRATAPKFYLDKNEETAAIKTEVKKLRNKALSLLQKMYDSNVNKLMYVCKVIDPNSVQYKKTTPTDIMYDNMDNYINGNTVETDKKKTAERFIDVANYNMETLKIRSIIKDSTYYKLIATKPDGYIYHVASNTMLGKNPSEIVEFLKNPLHENILSELIAKCEEYWNN
jgi:hypothetical protein